ncbi:MAG: serine hydrolase [Anaerolineales bacterium]|nr:serine hydrolase [Anaerolineales bacterium]
MRRQGFSSLRWISVFLLLFAVILTTVQIASYSRLRAVFPNGMSIAGISVGGLDRQAAAQRLLEAYNIPVELQYGDDLIQLDPAVVGFELDLPSMLAAADLERTGQSFWLGFWDYLWGRVPEAADIPLRADFSEQRLRTYLGGEIAPRYNQPAIPALPLPGTVNFQPGSLGTALDVERAILPAEAALRSTNQRRVILPLNRTLPPRPSFYNLDVLLRQTIELSEFDGLVGLFMLDLQNSQEIHFAYQQGENISVYPDIAFSAASIIKVPVLVSVFQSLDGEPDAETASLMSKMIEESGNEASDWVMQRVIDPFRAPLDVSEDMQALGLENTFLAGYFYQGAPLLYVYDSPANQREDINTFPDIYNQTTPSDIGMLLEDIYHCAQSGGGAFAVVFPDSITRAECQQMITLLTRNKMPSLLESGIPDGTQIAHKHGWVTNNGIINLIGDAGIIYTPGGNYVLAIFLYHPEQLLWDPASALVGQLSRAVYNFYNLETP